MPPALLVRFYPNTPWRPGSSAGARDAVQLPIGSDTVYAAITLAMRDLGWMEDWLSATTDASGAAVRLSSMFPFGGKHLFVAPPANLWPPEQTGRVRWESARLIPLTLIPVLLRDEALSEDRWAADPVSGCLLAVEKFGLVTPPFRLARRVTAAVDRVSQSGGDAVETTCVQFAPGAGMWFVAEFADDAAVEQWRARLQAACRLLADSGIGGERSAGWGKSDTPGFEEVDLVNRFCGSIRQADGGEAGYWLLSLFSPAPSDGVDWRRGNYNVVARNGRMHGSGALKKTSRMVKEGSVLIASERPRGTVIDVAPEGAAHPAYRNGSAVAIPIPWRETHRLSWLGADRAATEPKPPEPQKEETQTPAATIVPMDVMTVPVAEPVETESEPIGEQSLPEPMDEPGPVETEPVIAAGPAAPSDETPSAQPEERDNSSVPPIEEQASATSEPVPSAPVEEPPTEAPPVEPPSGPSAPVEEPPAEEPPVEPPTPTPTPVEEPPVRDPGSDSADVSDGEEKPQ